jgi:hypothetical protein
MVEIRWWLGLVLTLGACDGISAGDAGGSWEVSTERDPMTDAVISSAVKTLRGERHNVEVQVSCANAETAPNINYTVTSFGLDGQPAAMRQHANRFGSITVEARADGDPPFNFGALNPAYNNQATTLQSVVEEGGMQVPAGGYLGRANRVRLRLFLVSGEETVEFSQDDDAVRRVLSPCIQALDRIQQAQTEQQRQAKANMEQQEAQQAEEYRAQQQQAVDQQEQENLAAEERRIQETVAAELQAARDQQTNCDNIKRAGTTDQSYLSSQGCR